MIETDRFFHAFQTSDSDIVALVESLDRDTHLGKYTDDGRENDLLAQLNAQGQRFCDQNIAEAVNGQTGELIGFTENQTAAEKIRFRCHNRTAVFDGITHTAFPEQIVKAVVCIG